MTKCYRESKEERNNIVHRVKRRKADWIGHILCGNCLLKHFTEEKVERKIDVKGRRRRRCKHLLDDVNEKRGYCKLKDRSEGKTRKNT